MVSFYSDNVVRLIQTQRKDIETCTPYNPFNDHFYEMSFTCIWRAVGNKSLLGMLLTVSYILVDLAWF